MDCSTPGFPVHHQLLELAHTHVHRVDDAIQPSHPLSSPSIPAFSLSQHQSLFQWVSSLHQLTKEVKTLGQINKSVSWSGLGQVSSSGIKERTLPKMLRRQCNQLDLWDGGRMTSLPRFMVVVGVTFQEEENTGGGSGRTELSSVNEFEVFVGLRWHVP